MSTVRLDYDRSKILDGKAVSQTIRDELREEVNEIVQSGHKRPHLAAVLVGDDPASNTYVRNKVKACQSVGFESTLIRHDNNINQDQLLKLVKDLNSDEQIDGFIVQLPLPAHIDPDIINLSIDSTKDVDGFHPTNFGKMSLNLPSVLPATPQGIMFLLERYNIQTSGKLCVVIGRSNIVGRPISILLNQKRKFGNCTVVVTHSRTKDVKSLLKNADIIVAAIGKPEFIKKEMIKSGCVLIDVGINRIEDKTRKKGYRLVGDVDFHDVIDKCGFITPVPGGVGPMTVTSLLYNTLKASKLHLRSKGA